MTGLLTLHDLQSIGSLNAVVELFQKLNYAVTAQPIAIEDLELPKRSAEAIQDAYLLADYEQGSYALQILLFKLYPAEFSSGSLVRNRMKMIANSLYNRATQYLLIATKDYKQLLLSSPNKALDEQLNLVVSVESCLIDLASSSYQERNWLERIAARGLTPEALYKIHQKTFKDAREIQKAQGKDSFTEDSIRLYLNEIGRIRLLRADEEIELARKIADLMELERIRLRLAEKLCYDPSDREWANEVNMLLTAFRHRLHLGRRAKDKMVQSNLRLVVSIAKLYTNRGLDFQDLIQEGSSGLIRAAEKFDPELGYKFSTYATWWVKQAITRAIADQSRTIRLPVHLYETISRIKKTTKLLCQEMGRKPTEEEIATQMEMTIQKLRFITKSAQLPISLETHVGNGEDSRLGDFIESNGETPEDHVSKSLLRENLEVFLAILSSRERDVLRLRYGLDDGRMKTLEEIGQKFNVTRERIRQIEAKAFRKLRNPRTINWSNNCRLFYLVKSFSHF